MSKKNQEGFIDITIWDILFVVFVIAVGGALLWEGIQWLWTSIKPVIHSVTG